MRQSEGAIRPDFRKWIPLVLSGALVSALGAFGGKGEKRPQSPLVMSAGAARAAQRVAAGDTRRSGTYAAPCSANQDPLDTAWQSALKDTSQDLIMVLVPASHSHLGKEIPKHGWKFLGVIENFGTGSYPDLNVLPRIAPGNPSVTCVSVRRHESAAPLPLDAQLVSAIRDTVVDTTRRDHWPDHPDWEHCHPAAAWLPVDSYPPPTGPACHPPVKPPEPIIVTPGQLVQITQTFWFTCDASGCCKQGSH